MLREILEKIEGYDHEKLLAEESDYQKYFQDKLTKWKVKSPSELSKEERRKFFTEVEKDWK